MVVEGKGANKGAAAAAGAAAVAKVKDIGTTTANIKDSLRPQRV